MAELIDIYIFFMYLGSMCLVLDSDHWDSVFVFRSRLDLKFRYAVS
jgi:hypothetical protein